VDQSTVYALLAAGSYADIRRLPANNAPLPEGWKILPQFSISGSGEQGSVWSSGFSARVYSGPHGEIVISYAGTEFSGDNITGTANDLFNDATIAFGFPSRQVNAAAVLYQRVKAFYGEGANISFTGHSLGGGLAGLMAVWFNRPAIVFDPAPFQIAATRLYPAPTLKRAVLVTTYMYTSLEMSLSGYFDHAFTSYTPEMFAQRESLVLSYAIPGELLEYAPLPRIEAQRIPVFNGSDDSAMLRKVCINRPDMCLASA